MPHYVSAITFLFFLCGDEWQFVFTVSLGGCFPPLKQFWQPGRVYEQLFDTFQKLNLLAPGVCVCVCFVATQTGEGNQTCLCGTFLFFFPPNIFASAWRSSPLTLCAVKQRFTVCVNPTHLPWLTHYTVWHFTENEPYATQSNTQTRDKVFMQRQRECRSTYWWRLDFAQRSCLLTL